MAKQVYPGSYKLLIKYIYNYHPTKPVRLQIVTIIFLKFSPLSTYFIKLCETCPIERPPLGFILEGKKVVLYNKLYCWNWEILNNWKYLTHSTLGNHNSFESHAITVTGSHKTPDSSNLSSPWPNSCHLPRGAGRHAVLFHGGWHSTFSLWRFQHSPRQALCYRLPFTPSFIDLNALPLLARTNQATNLI